MPDHMSKQWVVRYTDEWRGHREFYRFCTKVEAETFAEEMNAIASRYEEFTVIDGDTL